MQWIDTHVHLFDDDKDINTPLFKGRINSPQNYIKEADTDLPAKIVIVDFSKASSSQHVISSLDVCKKIKLSASGVIRAKINDSDTEKWLKRSDIKAIRFYALDKNIDFSIEQDKWNQMFDLLIKEEKHVLIFGKPIFITDFLKKIPKDLDVVIDHFGMIDNLKTDIYRNLIDICSSRGRVYFKGPGYRTSLLSNNVMVFVRDICSHIGIEHMIIGASDSPFAGIITEDISLCGKNFTQIVDFNFVWHYINEIADSICNSKSDRSLVFYDNAAKLYF